MSKKNLEIPGHFDNPLQAARWALGCCEALDDAEKLLLQIVERDDELRGQLLESA